MKARSLLVILLVISFTFTLAEAAIINVPGIHITIQSALNAAIDGDSIIVHPGTYYEDIDWPTTNDITLTSHEYDDIAIINGNIQFSNTDSLAEMKNMAIHGCIRMSSGKPTIDSIQIRDFIAINYHSNPVLKNISFLPEHNSRTIRIDNSDVSLNSSSLTSSGLITNNSCRLKITNCNFQDVSIGYSEGMSSSVEFDDVTINGGTISLLSDSIAINHSTFINIHEDFSLNRTFTREAAAYLKIENSSFLSSIEVSTIADTLIIDSCLFSDCENQGLWSAGKIFIGDEYIGSGLGASIKNTLFKNNNIGLALSNYDNCLVENCQFIDNDQYSVKITGVNTEIINSVIEGNGYSSDHSSSECSGMDIQDSQVNIEQCLLKGNGYNNKLIESIGSEINILDSELIYNCGIASVSEQSTLNINNSIIANNSVDLAALTNDGTSQIQITNSAIINHDIFIHNNNECHLANNWWGNIEGPYSGDINPSGVGNRVIGVTSSSDIFPFLNEYPSDIPSWPYQVFRVPDNYSTINDAIDAIDHGDTLFISPGSYTLDIDWPRKKGIVCLGNNENGEIVFQSAGNNDMVNIEYEDNFNIVSVTFAGIVFSDITRFLHNSTSGDIFLNSNILRDCSGLDYYVLNETSGALNIKDNKFTDNTINQFIIKSTDGKTNINNSLFEDNDLVPGSSLIQSSESNQLEIDTTNFIHNSNMDNNSYLLVNDGQATLSISNSTFSENSGILSNESMSASLDRCSIVRNSGGIYSKNNGELNIEKSNMSNNGIFIVKGESSASLVTADNNWWGDITGPYHVYQNPEALGDSVNQYVQIIPWLTAPDPDAPPIPPTDIQINDITRTSFTISWDRSLLPDLAGYRVHFDTDVAGYPYADSVDVGTDTSYSFTGLTVGETYHLAVTTYDTDGNLSWYSQNIEVTTIVPVTIHIPDDYSTIQAGLIAANEGDTVLVAPGTYNENIIWPSTNGIKLFAEGDTNNTVIDGNESGRVLYFGSANIDTNTVIKGFTIQNGLASDGAGIKCTNNASPIFEYLLITGNNTPYSFNNEFRGGGIYINDANPTIRYTTVRDNFAYYYGGGIYVEESTAFISNCRIQHNSTLLYGAGISSFDASPTFWDTDVINNNANSGGNGGGFYIREGTPSITRVMIYGNSAKTGGGITCSLYGNPTLNDVNIFDNAAQNGGGIHLSFSSDLTINNCEIFNNSSSEKGGAIFCHESSTITATRSLLHNNFAVTDGNNIYLSNGQATINHSGLFGNGNSIINESENAIDAENNWWGNVSGPYQIFDNPGGLGDTISTNVTFTPFLTAPHPDAPPIPVQHPIVNSVSNTSVELSWDTSLIPDLAGYKVYYDTEDDGFPYSNSTDVGEVTNYVLTELSTSETYHISVVCYDDDGNESWYSDEITATTRNIDVRNLDIGGNENLEHLITHNPIIKYSYYDSMDEEQAACDIDVATNPEFTPVNMWNAGWVNTSDTTVVYDGNPLQDGQTYYLRVRVKTADGFEGNWSTLQFRMNSKPDQPRLVSPFDESVISVMRGLTANSVSDPEIDDVTYGLLVYDDVSCQNLIRNVDGLTDTSWTVSPELPDDQMYWWKAFTFDGYEYSDTTEAWSFLLNMQDDPPQAFSLISPADNDVLVVDTTKLVWHQSFEKDYGDSVIYHVFISETADFSSLTDELVTNDTTLIRRDLGDDKTYYWKVRAQDLNTSGTWSSETWSFTVDIQENPEAFTLLSPSNGVVVPNDTITVNWSATTDVDPGDEIIYEIQWSADPGFTNRETATTADTFFVLTDFTAPVVEMIQKRNDQGSKTLRNKNKSSSSLDELPDDTTIYWRVRAIDSDNSSVWAFPGENGFSFHVEMDEMPLPFSLVSPEDEWVSVSSDVTLTWESTTDADPQDETLTYYLLVARDDNFTEGLQTLEVEGTEFTVTGLLDDTTYWWKVRAQDSNSSGTWSNEVWSFDVAIPEAPESFVQLVPANGSLINVNSAEVNWSRSSDNDPDDELTYEIEWANNPTFTDAESATTADTFYTLDELTDDETMYWRVKVTDSYDLSTWAMAGENGWLFDVNIPQPPLPFSLVAPDSGLVLDTLAATFEWDATTDPDPGDEVSYVLSLSLAEDFRDTMTVYYNAQDVTSFPVPYMLDDTDYWWRVTASDQNGDFTLSNQTWTFHTAWPEPPHPFELDGGGIDMNTTGDSLIVTLEWHRTWDPDPESLEYYKVLLDTTDDMDIPIVLADSVLVSGPDSMFTWTKTYAPNELPMLGESFWTVYAYDDNTEGTWADEPFSIFMTHVDETPWGTIPLEYEFAAAYPNPFNPTLTAVISLPHPSDLTVQVFNVMGQRVATIAEGHFQEGFHSFVFNGQNMASGVYFIIANSPGKLNQVKKIVLMK